MKKSEMLHSIFVETGFSERHPASTGIISRMEELGQVWDPEEPKLPGKLQAYRAGEDWFLAPDDSDWETGAQKQAGYREAMRRYNLWPEAVQRLQDLPQVSVVSALIDLLVGGGK